MNSFKNRIRNFSFAAGSALALFIAAGANASAQNSASADAGSDSRVVAGLALERLSDLRFGTIVKNYSGGSVRIDPNSGSISYNGITRGQNTEYQMARFRASGEPGYLYSISLPVQGTLTRQGGSEQMWLSDFATNDGMGVLGGNGTQEFNVGATLGMASNQQTGNYYGSFNVAIQYQ